MNSRLYTIDISIDVDDIVQEMEQRGFECTEEQVLNFLRLESTNLTDEMCDIVYDNMQMVLEMEEE